MDRRVLADKKASVERHTGGKTTFKFKDMKTIVLGDTHGRTMWKDILTKENPERLIFIGDYFDSFDVGFKEQINNFLDICAFKDSNTGYKGTEVVMLIGNHDFHYMPEADEKYSGYQKNARYLISNVIAANRDKLQMAYQMGNILFTHAGVGETWCEQVMGKMWKKEDGQTYADYVNEIWHFKPAAFRFNGDNPYGDDMGQTPVWIRPLALTKDSHNLRKEIIQVVGHTGQSQLYLDDKSTLRGRYYFIDTLGTSKEYMIIEDGKIKVGKL